MASRKKMKDRLLLWLVASSFFMQMLDGTVLNNALPKIAEAFGRSPIAMQAPIVAYLLTVALLIPISGWLADRFGTRKVFFTAIVLFTLGSLLCALAVSFVQLILFRIVQGIGGGKMVPVGRLVVIKVSPKHELIASLTFITIPALIGPLIGPTLSGFLLVYANWRWIFLINIPVGVLGACFALKVVPELYGVRRSFDWLGFLLFGAAVILISLAVDGLGEWRFPWYAVLLCAVAGLASLVAFVVSARYSREPLFCPKLFSIRSFSVGIIGNLFARLANGAIPYLMPLVLQVAFGYSPIVAGLTLIPLTLASFLGKELVEPFLKRLGFRMFLFGNTIALGLLIASFGFVTTEMPVPLLWLLLGLLGTVNSMQFTSMNALTLYDLPDDLKSDGNSLLSIVMQLASSMGVATATVLLLFFAGHQMVDTHPSTLPVFQKTFFATGLIAVVAAMIFLAVPKEKKPVSTP